VAVNIYFRSNSTRIQSVAAVSGGTAIAPTANLLTKEMAKPIKSVCHFDKQYK
jgi:hypothetical protein